MPLDQSEILSSYPILDSLQMLQSNVAGGNLSGGARALLKPSEASPEERRKLSDRMGLTGTIFAPMVDIATHPLVLLGAILTWRYKMPSALELRAYKGVKDSLRKSVLPMLEGLSPPRVVFEGTPIPYDLDEAVLRHTEVFSPFVDRMEKLWNKMGVPTRTEWQRVIADMDGLNKTTQGGANSRSVAQLIKALSTPEQRGALGYSSEQASQLVRKLTSKPLVGVQLTERELLYRNELKGIYKDFWDNTLSKLPQNAETEELISVMLGGSGKGLMRTGKELEDYWPRFLKESDADASARLAKWLETKSPENMRPEQASWERMAAKLPKGPFESHRLDFRSGLLMPDSKFLADMGVDGDIVELTKRFSDTYTGGKQYSLAPDDISRYADIVGRVNGWAIPPTPGAKPIGRRISEQLEQMYRGDVTSQRKAAKLRNQYVPLLLGRMTPNQFGWSAVWEEQKEVAAGAFTKLREMGVVSKNFEERAQQAMLKDRNWSYAAAGQNISNFFYTNTLGGNVISAAKNLMQTVVTLAPTVGLRDLATGIRRSTEGAVNFAKLRASGKSTLQAFEEAFKEFHEAHLEIDPQSRALLGRALEDSYQSTVPLSRAGHKWDKISRQLLSVFSSSEVTNRTISFYASRSKAMRDFGKNLGSEVYDSVSGQMVPLARNNLEYFANKWARENTNRTQYGSGVLQRPSAIADWWTPHRQFLGYPLGTAGFLINEGIMTHPGIAARSLLYSGLAYSGIREAFGQDASDTLAFGANPIAQSDRPFAPFPAPPLLSLLGAGAMATTGDFKALQSALPTLLPGGVAASRVPGMLGFEGAAKGLGKPYVDYERPTPDGRYPLYSSKGALIGYITPTEIAARAIGITAPNEIQGREAMKMLQGAQTRIQGMRRRALEALTDNDAETLMGISAEWQRVYPGSGELPVSSADIRNVHLREDVTRTERLLESLPPGVRQQYAAALATAVSADFPAFMGLTSDLTAGKTISEREAFRTRPISGTEQRLGPSLHGKKLSEKLRDEGLTRDQPVTLMEGGQTGFGGYGKF